MVEDDPCAAFLLRTMLQKDGYSVQHCADGEMALKTLLETDFDAVVLDLMMPKIDGLQVLKEMRASSRHLLTPVVLLTAAKLKIIEDQAALYRVRLYLEKTEIPRLREALREILAESPNPEATKLRMASSAEVADEQPLPSEPARTEAPRGLSRLFGLRS